MSRPVDFWSEIHQALSHRHSRNYVGVDRVSAAGDRLYTPDPDGPILAAIVAVMPGNEIIDLVAIDLSRPNRWRRRVGVADMLGEANLRGLNFSGEPLRVHPGPAEWLDAGADGAVVLEFTPSACSTLLSIPGGLVVDRQHMDFGRRLRERLIAGTAPSRPNIFVIDRTAGGREAAL